MADATRSALVVATATYDDPGLRRLRAPAADATALAGVLGDDAIGGFDVRTLVDEPAHLVARAIEDFFADRRPDDLLLLHVSCHGVKDEGGELHFATVGTDLRRLASTSVPAEFVNRRMGRSRSRRIVLLLDCCYAGAFERGMTARAGTGIHIEERFGGRGRAVITASTAMEYAFEGQTLADSGDPTPSVFTTALVDGLATGDADRDQDGLVALGELYEHVYARVRDTTPNQTPSMWTFGLQGELYLARRARPVTTPTPLPVELQQVLDHPLAGVRGGAVQELSRLLAGRHAGLALAARLALEGLTDDDSRAVAAEAAAALAGSTPKAAAPRPPTTDRTAPATDDGPTRTVTTGALERLAGQLAVLAPGLLVGGLFLPVVWGDFLVDTEPPLTRYVGLMALLSLAVGALALARRTRWRGRPVLVGLGAAASWGLVAMLAALVTEEPEAAGPGLWLLLGGHALLVLAAVLAGIGTARSGTARLRRPPRLPHGELVWLVMVLGVVGAAALVVQAGGLWGEFSGNEAERWRLAPAVWGAVLAASTPTLAALTAPRHLGVSLLFGWVAGAAAFFTYYEALLRGNSWSVGSAPALVFGLTLLGLLVTGVLLARPERRPPVAAAAQFDPPRPPATR